MAEAAAADLAQSRQPFNGQLKTHLSLSRSHLVTEQSTVVASFPKETALSAKTGWLDEFSAISLDRVFTPRKPETSQAPKGHLH